MGSISQVGPVSSLFGRPTGPKHKPVVHTRRGKKRKKGRKKKPAPPNLNGALRERPVGVAWAAFMCGRMCMSGLAFCMYVRERVCVLACSYVPQVDN